MYIIKKDPNHTDDKPYLNVEALEYFHCNNKLDFSAIQDTVNRVGEWVFWDTLAKAHYFKLVHEAIAVAKKLNLPTTVYLFNGTTSLAEVVWEWKYWIKSQ